MSSITRGELARGFARKGDWQAFCSHFTTFEIDDDILWKAAEIFEDLRRRGAPTGENDLWIGATAIVAGQPLVTENAKDFEKMSGLRVSSHLKRPGI